MPEQALTLEAGAAEASEVQDYWRLLKPNVMSLVVFSGAAGLYLAPGSLHPVLAFVAVLCIAVGAGAAAAINNGYDADIDRLMARTRRRPTASGRIDPEDALACGVTLALIAVMVMGLAVNWVAATLLALTIAFYVFVYTLWLKRRTPQNIVIGGAAGAFPPMVGWAAVNGEVSLASILLFLIIFFWTPPHFWALALYRCNDYARAGVPMLPVVAGAAKTRQQVLGYTALLVLVSLLPWALGLAGPLFGLAALALGGGFLAYAVRLWRDRSQRTATRTFRYSIVYLFALFGALVVDKALGFGGLG
jgi:protoheme IX farnesyltransferase